MTPFIMDAESAEKLQKVAEFAEENRIYLDEMKRRVAAAELGQPIDLGKGYQTELPFGFKVVFTIEQHPYKDGSGAAWVRHMSMSAPRQGRIPHDLAMQWVMGQLGYTSSIKECMVYPEDIGPDRVAINVLEQVQENAPAGRA